MIYDRKIFIVQATGWQFGEKFTRVAYGTSKLSCKSFIALTLPYSVIKVHSLYATAVNYARKMFVKFPTGTNVMKLFTALSYEFS